MDLGGVKDTTELWGHRRTYKNSLPGRFIHALSDLGCANPVILLNEIEKIADSQVTSALLALLEPTQCKSFVDHYFEVAVDLSNVLFICTANSLDPLPSVLRDRMEVLTLRGYNEMDKVAIARDFKIKEIREKYGLHNHGISIDENVLVRIVRGYCPEPGLRNLKRVLEKIAGKVAIKLCRFQEDCEASAESSTRASAQQEVSADRGDKVDGPTETATENQAQAETDNAYDMSNEVSQPKQVPDFMKVTSKDVARYLGARHPLARTFSEETVVD